MSPLDETLELNRKVRVQANVEVYNVLNASSILGVNTTYGP